MLFWTDYYRLVLDLPDLLRSYLKQLREETSSRLMERAYHPNGTQNKWWIAFSKQRFLNMRID